ncbi:uncharacterized protein BDZ83DRAFT_609882 [Colletotrichum acutatum]|uniref:Uncharacterized protein n=1 Tax=Glomerella acutata TaxID=27357 RepID=A0AAD8UV25_GLOAC|nr:uncharacterized protein BDZ83DRAFT_609882 [Colletotrichum acutatum]KAK1728318.1 hypothetical protein BDZ83DRAFT_609882 [Colletotrichum acutatum]
MLSRELDPSTATQSFESFAIHAMQSKPDHSFKPLSQTTMWHASSAPAVPEGQTCQRPSCPVIGSLPSAKFARRTSPGCRAWKSSYCPQVPEVPRNPFSQWVLEASSRPESLEHEGRDFLRRPMVGAAQRRPVGLRQRIIDGSLPCPELRALLTASLTPGADCQARAPGPVTAGSGPDAAPTWISLRLRAVSGPTYVYSELQMAPNIEPLSTHLWMNIQHRLILDPRNGSS